MNIVGIINNNIKIDKDNYYKLIKLYGKENLSTVIDKYIKDRLEEDFSRESQTKLWDRFGYYLACQEKTVFEDVAISRIKMKMPRGRDFTLKEEKKYSYLLLIRPYIELFDKNGAISIEQIFASISNVTNRDYILERFNYMYNNISRISYMDTEIKKFINDYKKLCIKVELPKVNYDGDLIGSQELLDQVDMYVRYSIAFDKMLIGNLAIIDRIINNRAYLLEEYDYDELYQDGYFGLVKAVGNYDVRYGNTFIMSASRWIVSYILKNKKFDLFSANISQEAMLFLNQVNKEDELALITIGRKLTDLEMSLKFGVSIDKIREIRLVQHQFDKLYLEDLDFNDNLESDYQYTSKELNFNDNLENDNQYTWKEVISDNSYFSDKVEEHELYEYILKLMDEKLSEKERNILLMRAEEMSLNNIGSMLGITYERVRQLETRGIKKVRRNSGVYNLLNNKERANY